MMSNQQILLNPIKNKQILERDGIQYVVTKLKSSGVFEARYAQSDCFAFISHGSAWKEAEVIFYE
ncbi:hypothetical protein [Methylotenera sp.]|uniref:hypothetical protein n=1 Tax=Methylotenera sp. TaxID=2051956 RepID=UPI00272D2B9C|nr:hypothetical protein [Methylotenera sp.]MDP2071826.1 hypothetical protein [Methylotenera sp.]